MTVIVISVIGGWIVFSAILVTIICMNSSRLSRIDEPFKPTPISEAYSPFYSDLEVECDECFDTLPMKDYKAQAGLCVRCYKQYKHSA